MNPGKAKATKVELDDTIELELIKQDGGNAEAGRFRVGLAMVLTMVAEIAKEQPGKSIPAGVLDGLAGDIVTGTDKGVSFVGAHVGRMMKVRMLPMGTRGDDA